MYHNIRMFHGKAFVGSYFRQPSRTAGTTKSQGVAFIQGQQLHLIVVDILLL
jgi:hypothetical protein